MATNKVSASPLVQAAPTTCFVPRANEMRHARAASYGRQRRCVVRFWNDHAARRRRISLTGKAGSAPLSIPTSIYDVDNGKLLGFGAELAEDHPGFRDEEYKQRRVNIATLARAHEIGEPIPRVEYTASEVAVWGRALQALEQLFDTHACSEFCEAYKLFNFRPDEVPQLEDVSAVIKAKTGWQIRPVAGLMHPRDFLAGLAFKYFHSTQYIRHASKPDYTPEPDVVHELIGHVPMLANPTFCNMVQAIGMASLGADEQLIWHLTKVYWYTVEFGVVMEGGNPRAFGAGVLSSYGELAHLLSGVPEFVPFDPYVPQPKMSYKDGFQRRYFVLPSFTEGAALLNQYACDVHAGKASAPLPRAEKAR